MAKSIGGVELTRLKTLWHDPTITQQQIARRLDRSESRIRELGIRLFGRRPRTPSINAWLPIDIDRLRRFYQQGHSVPKIAKLLGRGVPAVKNALWKFRVRNRLDRLQAQKEKALRLLRKRRSLIEVSRQYKVSFRIVRRWRDEAGIAPLSLTELGAKKATTARKSPKISGGLGRVYAEKEASIRLGWPWCHAGHRQLLERIEADPLPVHGLRPTARRNLVQMAAEGWVVRDDSHYRLAPAVIERRAEHREASCTTPLAPARPACTAPGTGPTPKPGT